MRVIRWPVRIVTLVVLVPLRMLWDALTVCGRALKRALWTPFARAVVWLWRRVLSPVLYGVFVWPWTALWRYVLAPAGRGLAWLGRQAWAGLRWLGRNLVGAPLGLLWRYVLLPAGRGIAAAVRGVGAALAWLGRTLVATPLRFLWEYVLVPFGYGIGVVCAWLWRYLVVVPCTFVYGYVLAPLGRGIAAAVRGIGIGLAWLWQWLIVVPVRGVGAALAWLWRWLVVVPCRAVLRYVLAPVGRGLALVGREFADAVVVCWRVAGRISRAVFRFLGRVLRFLFVDPVRWMWRNAVRPVGRGLRDGIWRPAARVLREAGRGVGSAVAAARLSVRQTRQEIRYALFGGSEPVTERKSPSASGRVPLSAGSPHDGAGTPDSHRPA